MSHIQLNFNLQFVRLFKLNFRLQFVRQQFDEFLRLENKPPLFDGIFLNKKVDTLYLVNRSNCFLEMSQFSIDVNNT